MNSLQADEKPPPSPESSTTPGALEEVAGNNLADMFANLTINLQ